VDFDGDDHRVDVLEVFILFKVWDSEELLIVALLIIMIQYFDCFYFEVYQECCNYLCAFIRFLFEGLEVRSNSEAYLLQIFYFYC
jgi:hypothetical protein